MARDDLFFQRAGVLHPRYRTPAGSLIVQAIWTCILCLSGTYTELLRFVVFAAVLFYMLTTIGLFLLRRKQPTLPRPVRAIGYPWLPALYILATGLIALNLLLTERTRTYSALGLGLVLLGIPVYYAWRRKTRSTK